MQKANVMNIKAVNLRRFPFDLVTLTVILTVAMNASPLMA